MAYVLDPKQGYPIEEIHKINKIFVEKNNIKVGDMVVDKDTLVLITHIHPKYYWVSRKSGMIDVLNVERIYHKHPSLEQWKEQKQGIDYFTAVQLHTHGRQLPKC